MCGRVRAANQTRRSCRHAPSPKPRPPVPLTKGREGGRGPLTSAMSTTTAGRMGPMDPLMPQARGCHLGSQRRATAGERARSEPRGVSSQVTCALPCVGCSSAEALARPRGTFGVQTHGRDRRRPASVGCGPHPRRGPRRYTRTVATPFLGTRCWGWRHQMREAKVSWVNRSNMKSSPFAMNGT